MIISAEILDPDGTECHQLPTLTYLLSIGTVVSVERVLVYMGKPGLRALLPFSLNTATLYVHITYKYLFEAL